LPCLSCRRLAQFTGRSEPRVANHNILASLAVTRRMVNGFGWLGHLATPRPSACIKSDRLPASTHRKYLLFGREDIHFTRSIGHVLARLAGAASVDGILYCPLSLVTENFTGKFGKTWVRHASDSNSVVITGLQRKFPAQRKREILPRSWESQRRNREFSQPKGKASPDGEFLWVISALTSITDMGHARCHVRPEQNRKSAPVVGGSLC
jgi:hypothetical protein